MPSFGSTIRKISRNVSEMKQMAGRDIEDILQVCLPSAIPCITILNTNGTSVRFLSLTVSFPRNIITTSCDSCMCRCNGMAWPSCGCTRRTPFDSWMTQPPRSVTNYENSVRKRVQLSTHGNSSERFKLASVEKVRKLCRRHAYPSLRTQKNPAIPVEDSRPSTLPRTRSMPSAIMQPQSEGSARQTLIPLRQFVPPSFRNSLIKSDPLQGELEHRTTKARYRRTSRKQYVKQMAQIERRQSRIRRIRERNKTTDLVDDELEPELISAPDAHHVIGKSQNNPRNVPLFLQANAGDPAVKVRLFSGEAFNRSLLTLTCCRTSFPN